MEQTEDLLYVVCLHACATEARTIATWLMEQVEGLLNVRCAYMLVVCLPVCVGA